VIEDSSLQLAVPIPNALMKEIKERIDQERRVTPTRPGRV